MEKVLWKKLNKFYVGEVLNVSVKKLYQFTNFMSTKWKNLTRKFYKISYPRRGKCLARKSVQGSCLGTEKSFIRKLQGIFCLQSVKSMTRKPQEILCPWSGKCLIREF